MVRDHAQRLIEIRKKRPKISVGELPDPGVEDLQDFIYEDLEGN
jgi:hypothetical protein